MPHAASAHGACSRELPVPKLSPASRILRPGHPGLVEDERRVLERPVLLEPPVAEQRVGEALLVGDLEVARRDDLVGVDVLGRQRHDRAREARGRLGHLSTPRRRSTSASMPGQRARVGDHARDRRRGRGQRRGEERPAALALAPLEVAVRAC